MSGNTRAADFRYIYANATKIQFGPNELLLGFGIKEDANAPDDVIREEVIVAMSPVAAKLLAITLARTIETFEAASSVTIPVDPAKMEHLENALRNVGKAVPT